MWEIHEESGHFLKLAPEMSICLHIVLTALSLLSCKEENVNNVCKISYKPIITKHITIVFIHTHTHTLTTQRSHQILL